MSATSPSPASQLKLAWHTEPADDVLHKLQSNPQGLTQHESRERLERFGPNQLPEKGPTPLWIIFFRQFISPLIYILVGAAIVSMVIGDFKDAIFIGIVLLINAGIGTYQEGQAEKSSHALRKLLRMHAQVQRDGEVREIMADEIVPGDIVWLESGNRVAADIRLLSSQGLEIDESLLTGESIAVAKVADSSLPRNAPLAEQLNMGFAGSMVTRGRAKGVVVGTGLNTQVGQLAVDVMATSGGAPPLLTRMERFTNQVAIGTLVASIAIGALGMFLWKHTLLDTFFLVIALSVSAIPEGLPVAMTVALAVATNRMAKRNVIVRRLTAVEGLGSCTLVATDKTGTLTCNELTVRELRLADGKHYTVTGEGFTPTGNILFDGHSLDSEGLHPQLLEMIRAVLLCNESELHQRDGGWTWRGDAVDIALLALGYKLGRQRESLLDTRKQLNQIPFESEHQFAATYHRDDRQTLVVVKGAPERLLSMCYGSQENTERQRHEQTAISMAEHGLRVIAVAQTYLPYLVSEHDVPPRPEGLQLLGFVGMIDPLRADSKTAVKACHEAGVKVTMITGDHRVTALAMARYRTTLD